MKFVETLFKGIEGGCELLETALCNAVIIAIMIPVGVWGLVSGRWPEWTDD